MDDRSQPKSYKHINIPQMLSKLDEMYVEESELVKKINLLYKKYHQLIEDKELLQNLIMYASNRNVRQG